MKIAEPAAVDLVGAIAQEARNGGRRRLLQKLPTGNPRIVDPSDLPVSHRQVDIGGGIFRGSCAGLFQNLNRFFISAKLGQRRAAAADHLGNIGVQRVQPHSATEILFGNFGFVEVKMDPAMMEQHERRVRVERHGPGHSVPPALELVS